MKLTSILIIALMFGAPTALCLEQVEQSIIGRWKEKDEPENNTVILEFSENGAYQILLPNGVIQSGGNWKMAGEGVLLLTEVWINTSKGKEEVPENAAVKISWINGDELRWVLNGVIQILVRID